MFQFTHPVWGATYVPYRLLIPNYVSIHAPRVGCDFSKYETLIFPDVFQFTHPVWGATDGVYAMSVGEAFQFTHPVWGATWGLARRDVGIKVSIHAPRVGCDERGDMQASG